MYKQKPISVKRQKNFTLEVKEGAGIGGLLRGGLSDWEQVGAITPQDGRHETQEGLLDLQFKRVEALPAMELMVS